MSDQRKVVPYLRAVVTKAGAAPIEVDLLRSPAQGGLFVSGNEALLCFVNMEALSSSDFNVLIATIRARIIVDLRAVPRFDIGALTRKIAFGLFQAVGSKYIDLPGRLGVTARRDSRLNPDLLGQELRSFLSKMTDNEIGPVLLLIDASQAANDFVVAVADHLSSLRARGWEVMQVPGVMSGGRARLDASKSMVFISHANPEDNDAAAWLASRLTLAGYQVWSDVTKLIGGELFWNTIEEAIRNFSAKVIVLLSKSALNKHGVLDEINCAISYERATNIQNFVIPIRLDTLPFAEMHANVSRKNIIDFSDNWAVGLTRLLGALVRDGVPRSSTGEHFGSLIERSFGVRERTSDTADKLVSNWLPIPKLPRQILFVARGNGDELASALDGANALPSRGLDARFFDSSGPESTEHGDATMIEVEVALRSGIVRPVALDQRHASNLVTHLLRHLWSDNMRRRGLMPYELASGLLAWYAPKGLIEGDFVSFRDLKGKRRRKYLLGRSEKRGVYWHFAIEAKPVLARINRFQLISHVVFTEDGLNKLVPAAKMHTLRRGFCKNWWNDRWRDLTRAFLAMLSDFARSNEIVLTESGDVALRLRANMMQFSCPVTPMEKGRSDAHDELLADMEWEDLDVVEDDELERDLDTSEGDA
jgi:hypothetical protein